MKSIDHNKQSRILVVDDSRSARELIRLFLEKNGYAVTTAADGKEAVKKFREGAIDLVLMDANMPVVDGYRACAEIRRSPNGTDVSIIMITGQDDDASVERAFDAGAEEYITKPIHWIVLQKRIDLSLNNRFAQEAVAEGRARMEAIVNTAADGIIVINQAGEIESVNVSAEKMFGYAHQEMLGKNIAIIMPSPHREAHDQHLARYHASGLSTALGVTLERLAVKKNGKTFPIELRISQVKIKDRVLFTGILRDITERKLAEEKIFYQANYDALTGIANRGVFMSTLHQTVETASRNGQTSALVFVDLDRFKWVNDTLGHAAGDELLKASAKRIQACLRQEDGVFRLGGDEFTVIIPNSTRDQATQIAHQILHQLNESFLLLGTAVHISGSLGVAFFPQDAQDVNGLLKCADEAMYRSKKAGRNACHLFSGESFALQRNY